MSLILRHLPQRLTYAAKAEGLRLAACNPDADPADIVEQLSEIAHSTCNAGIGTKRIRTLADVPDVFSLDTADISYIVPELVPRGSLILLSGEPGIGKSYLVLKLLVCCAFRNRIPGPDVRADAVPASRPRKSAHTNSQSFGDARQRPRARLVSLGRLALRTSSNHRGCSSLCHYRIRAPVDDF